MDSSYDICVGDAVIVNKPYDIHETPTWVSDMDKYNGCETIIKGVRDDGCVLIDADNGRFVYNRKWMELVSDLQDDSEPDDEELMEYINEYRKLGK